MNFSKFKKKTNSIKFISKLKPVNFDNLFSVVKVINIINYYTVEAIIYNENTYNTVTIELKDVNFFDNKINDSKRQDMKKKLTEIVLDKYFYFDLDDIISTSDKHLKFVGTLTYCEDEARASINTTIKNIIINILVMRDKIKTINSEEGKLFKRKCRLLPLIIEDKNELD